mgnify:FL=1|jgi:hypothetical protein
MFKDRNGIVIQCVNRKGMMYNGCKVPYMGLYGTLNGKEFVAEPRLNVKTGEMRLKHRDLKTKARWDDIPDKKIVTLIVLAAKAGCVQLYKWDTKMVSPDQNKAKKEAAFWCKEAANPDTIRRFKVKVKYQNSPMTTHEYGTRSHILYGESIDMNGKIKKIEQVQNYMDGTGMSSSFDNRDRRPLNPVFPVKSGKR